MLVGVAYSKEDDPVDEHMDGDLHGGDGAVVVGSDCSKHVMVLPVSGNAIAPTMGVALPMPTPPQHEIPES